ncbi:c-type cytochrome [Xanthomonas sacchari]|uniref:c-type cytochrome n=1 Tax=Xanthomonas sacchari TaxID=56458 RepID=UPI00225949C7|nr:c-type cytochrome [Xanthomonas sacchari]UYK86749.1 c-type cytochrome [Xanthomonas sacchari]
MKRTHALSLCTLLAGLLPLAAVVASSAQAAGGMPGAGVFASECAECHSAAPAKNKKGPTLFGVAGRRAGSVPDYAYSDAMKQSQWTWSDDKLRSYLSQPASKALPGGKMKYDGLDDAKQLQDLIAYLHSLH